MNMIIITSFAGTIVGNVLNYLVGRIFNRSSFVINRMNNLKAQKAREVLRSRGLFIYILVCRFIAVTRPLYALLLGGFGIKFRRFIIYEMLIAFAWTIFWLFILVQGEALFFHLFR